MDDILVSSFTKYANKTFTHNVINLLTKEELSTKITRFQFCVTTTEFLRYQISQAGITLKKIAKCGQ
jgi:hypothetical protein